MHELQKQAKAKIKMKVDGGTVNASMEGNVAGLLTAATSLVMNIMEHFKRPTADLEESLDAVLCAIEENVIGNLKEKEETPSVQRVALASSLGDGAKEDAPGGAGV